MPPSYALGKLGYSDDEIAEIRTARRARHLYPDRQRRLRLAFLPNRLDAS